MRVASRRTAVLFGALSIAVLAIGAFPGVASAAGVPYATGDVFAGVGNGQVKHFSRTGTLLDTLDDTSGSSETTGMAFDSSGNLFSTDWTAGAVSKYDDHGNFLSTFASGIGNPESLVFNNVGDLYVSDASSGTLRKYDAAGNLLTSFALQTESRGVDWIDLAADNCTMYYTSEGSSILRFNVCTNTQLAPFTTSLTGAAAYALRIRPNGEVLVADSGTVERFDSAGNGVQSYTVPGDTQLFALNLDPDGTSFWTGDIGNGDIAHIDIATGNVLGSFNSAPNSDLAGLAVRGEITVSVTTSTTTTTTTTTTVPTSSSTSTTTSSSSTTIAPTTSTSTSTTTAPTTTTSTTTSSTSTSTTVPHGTTTTAPSACKPGWGFGDANHCHSGPPGNGSNNNHGSTHESGTSFVSRVIDYRTTPTGRAILFFIGVILALIALRIGLLVSRRRLS